MKSQFVFPPKKLGLYGRLLATAFLVLGACVTSVHADEAECYSWCSFYYSECSRGCAETLPSDEWACVQGCAADQSSCEQSCANSHS